MRAAVLALSLLAAACGRVHGPEGACTTAADCGASAPYCIDQTCSASCETNTDCASGTAPLCATDGACVACLSNTDCTDASAPICDATARSCRGCSADSDCSGGVCVEATGKCVADADVVFATMMGKDTGTCTRAAPCASLTYAMTQAGARTVFHVLGSTLSLSGTLSISSDLTFDGEDTILSAPQTSSFAISKTANVIVEGFHLTGPTVAGTNTQPPAVSAGDQSTVTLYGDTFTGPTSLALSTSPKVTLSHSHLGSLDNGGTSVTCSGGQLLATQNVFETSSLGSFGECDLTVQRNRFESALDGSVQLRGGRLLMENNLIIHKDGYNDSISVATLSAGSTIRFNTIVNTTALPSDGAALACDSTVVVTSNVFAYNSGHVITGSCETRYSVFDTQALSSAGTGNKTADIEAIFVARASGDYHLSPDSVARGASEPGLTTMVTTDFDGKPRPAPAGSTADSGAFEAN